MQFTKHPNAKFATSFTDIFKTPLTIPIIIILSVLANLVGRFCQPNPNTRAHMLVTTYSMFILISENDLC